MNAQPEISPLPTPSATASAFLPTASAVLLTLTAVYLQLLEVRKRLDFSRQNLAATAAWENEGGRIDPP